MRFLCVPLNTEREHKQARSLSLNTSHQTSTLPHIGHVSKMSYGFTIRKNMWCTVRPSRLFARGRHCNGAHISYQLLVSRDRKPTFWYRASSSNNSLDLLLCRVSLRSPLFRGGKSQPLVFLMGHEPFLSSSLSRSLPSAARNNLKEGKKIWSLPTALSNRLLRVYLIS